MAGFINQSTMQAALAAVDTEGARRATEVSTAASAAQTHRTSSDVHGLSICDLNAPSTSDATQAP